MTRFAGTSVGMVPANRVCPGPPARIQGRCENDPVNPARPASTIRDVARVAGVSLGTVSNYLTDTKPVSSQARARIDAAVRELSFVPNLAGRVMRGGRNAAIGFVVVDAPDPFFVEVARGVEDVAREAGLVLVSCNTLGDPDIERRYLTTLAEMRIVGVIMTPAYSGADSQLESLRVSGTSVVVMGVAAGEFDACSIAIDDVRGGELAMQHLLDRGHSDVVFVGGPGAERQIRDRMQGARSAMARAGLDPDRLRRLDAVDSTATGRAAVGERIATMRDRPTAVMCASDSLALAVFGILQQRGLRVPDDVAIIGYNDIEQAGLAGVPLSSISTPKYEIGQTAARMLLAESAPRHEHRHVRLEPALIVRQSTTPAA